MPVTTKQNHKALRTELINRSHILIDLFDSRDLESDTEGAGGKGRWPSPELMTITNGSATEISISIEDFKTILAEIKKLK